MYPVSSATLMITFWRTLSCSISWGCALTAECCSLKTCWEMRYAAGLFTARDARLPKSAAPLLFMPRRRNRPKWAKGTWTRSRLCINVCFLTSLFSSVHIGWVPWSSYLWGDTQHFDLWKWAWLGRHGPAGVRGRLVDRCGPVGGGRGGGRG